MANKKITMEERVQQYEAAKKHFEELGEQLKIAMQEEEDRKKAQLALEKENRQKEVEEARDTYHTLLKAYIEDYGSYKSTCRAEDYDWFPNAFWRSFF